MTLREFVYWTLVHAMWACCFMLATALLSSVDRYEVIPTPRGTIILDKAAGYAYQRAPLPMFQTRE